MATAANADVERTLTARHCLHVSAECHDDKDRPSISSILPTLDGQRLVLADRGNKKIKLVNMPSPLSASITANEAPLASTTLKEAPFALARLNDDLIASTTDNAFIYLLTVTENSRTNEIDLLGGGGSS
jgi:hypothetical protein